MRRLLLLLPLLLGADAPPDLGWLEGTWLAAEGAQVSQERWVAREGGLAGTGRVLVDGRTVFTETLRIEPDGTYTAWPEGAAAPTRFPLVAHGPTSAVFEDPTHDFPRKIAYERDGDRLTATLEGVEGGVALTRTWTWQRAPRRVAVTVDDLPSVGKRTRTPSVLLPALATHLTSRDAPAVGFVVGDRDGLGAVRAWTEAGLALGNHSATHRAYSRLTVEDYLADVARNETLVREAVGVELRGTFFRYPFLDHGHSAEKVDAMTAWMDATGTRHAPVSLDTVDYRFNDAYVTRCRDPEVAALYVAHVVESAAHFEALSISLYDREIPLVLLVHANELGADHLGAVLDALSARGYAFVPLAEALADPSYTAFGNRPPHLPLDGDRNFLNQVALERGLRVDDPSGDAHFDAHWAPRIEALGLSPCLAP